MSVYIVRRETKTKGTRWHVKCELSDARMAAKRIVTRNGEATVEDRLVIHLGVYETEDLAKQRRKTAMREIALGQTPQKIPTTDVSTTTLGEVGAAWLASRHDLSDVTRIPYERMIRTWPATLSSLNPAAMSHADVQEWVSWLAQRPLRTPGKKGGLKRGSIARELNVLKMVLDYAGVPYNAARDRNVKLPRRQRRQHRLPTRLELAAIREALPSRVPLMDLLEHTGLRISEAGALRWRDIDHARARLLVADSKTAAGRRFVEHLLGTPPFPVPPSPDADPSALVFPQARSFTNVLRETHERRGTFLMSAHDFRHLAASRWLHEGTLSPAEIAQRLGHSTPAITLGTYSHLVPPD